MNTSLVRTAGRNLHRLPVLVLLCAVPHVAHAAGGNVIKGVAVAPAGQKAKGTVATVCPYGDSNPKACIVSAPISEDSRVAPFSVSGVDSRNSYTVVLWKDNGDGKMGEGDWVGTFMNRPNDRSKLRPVSTNRGFGLIPLVPFSRLGNHDALVEPFDGKGTPLSDLEQAVGTWVHETSGTQTALAAGTGPAWQSVQVKGGMSSTTLRGKWTRDAVVLTINKDRSFTWYSPTDTFDDNECARIETAEQSGTVSKDKDVLTLKNGPGKITVQESCHPEKDGVSPIAAGEGSFKASFQEGPDKRLRMKLENGGARFIFVKQAPR